MVLRIEADGAFSYKTFALPSPDRYVVDLGGVWQNMRPPTVPSNMMIKSARVGAQGNSPRLVLDMQRPPRKHSMTWTAPTVLEIYIE
ncbi:MAG: AMIN domain-containing protein [Deltaproteobacteria bacterium]|nr:AMIN domain-containing protein [Deltaproteobacteria bacterium]